MDLSVQKSPQLIERVNKLHVRTVFLDISGVMPLRRFVRQVDLGCKYARLEFHKLSQPGDLRSCIVEKVTFC